MNERLEKYLEQKEQRLRSAREREKRDLLIREGLYNKEYSESWSGEYPNYDGERGKYFREVPIEINDEEYELVKEACKYDNKVSENDDDISNRIATVLTVIAYIIYIGGFIAGICLGKEEVTHGIYYTYTSSEFSFAAAFIYWVIFFVCGTMFLGFAEIIKLLETIKRK